ncbi:hypothetical protein ACP275_01G109700 [Erythranthe tilingii]
MPLGDQDQASNSLGRSERSSIIGAKRKLEADIFKKSKYANEDLRNLGFTVTRSKRSTKRVSKKRTTILSWLIDSSMFQENVEIFSVDERRKLEIKNKGRIKRGGILCMCCNNILTVAKFHLHGGKNCDKPYENIFIAKTNVSLLSYMNEASNKAEVYESRKFNIVETKENTSDVYDDACVICADGGDLMCCEDCNSTYHQVCMDMEDVPEGTWYCPYCVCKFCAKPADKNDYLLKCPQCEKKYHWECHQIKEQRNINLNSISIAPFCERSCKEVCDKLREKIVGKRNQVDGGYSWTLLHHQIDDNECGDQDKYSTTICHSKLAVAKELMEQCFQTIQDRYTGIKIIPSVIYNCGSNFGRLSFQGFYTAILEKDEEIITAASLRIHGTKLAEMPFIATSEPYRRKGMCRKLMIAIEEALCYLSVENLIIPSLAERIQSWINGYGFSRLNLSMEKEIMAYNTLMFHDSVRLQKILPSSSNFNPHGSAAREMENHQNGLNYKSKLPMQLDLNIQPSM